MLRQANARRVVVPNKPAAMINRPTVVPTVEAGGSLPNLGTDKYFALRADRCYPVPRTAIDPKEMRTASLKNAVISQLNGLSGTGVQSTVQPLPNIDELIADKSQIGQSADPQPTWQETVPKGRQMWFTVGMVAAALVVVYFLLKQNNRFARNAGEGILLIEKLEQRYGIRVISVMENISIDPHSPFFFKMRADMLVMAEFERRVISDQSKAGIW